MDLIREWLQTLTALVIMIGFFEMLLPNSEIKKFAKLVLGLAIMMAVLQPILSIVNLNWEAYLPEQTQPRASADWMALAEKLQSSGAQPVFGYVDQTAARQVEALILAIGEVEDATVEILSSDDKIISIDVSVRSEVDVTDRVGRVVAHYMNVNENLVTVRREQGVEGYE